MMLLAVLLGAVSLTMGTEKTRSSGFPKSSSGITYAGGSTYYVVADDNSGSPAEVGLYKVTLTTSDDGKTISGVTVGPRVELAMATDLEAVAYDPASGHVWAANETTTKTIKEYDPETGAQLSTLTVPSVMFKDRGNYGFESLTIAGDGLTMWTANEESLTVDGPRSAYGVCSTNRLVKFTRESVDRPWQLAAMYPYVTDSWHELYGLGGSGRRGISDMCALPDGSLLVLERELSSNTAGDGIGAKLSADFYIAIYRITPEAMSAATDVKEFPALNAGGWTRIAKGTSLVDAASARGWRNWEGFCLGTRLPDGTCLVPMLTDAGDGYTSALLQPLVLSGLDIRTLDFPAPSSGDVASIVGSNYRYLNGATVNVGLTGSGFASGPYTNRSDRLASWSLTTSGRGGTGPAASFVVSGDDTLVWTVAASGGTSPIIGHDTFEGQAAGTDSTAIAGWGENGTVVAATYPAPSVGTPMQKATHTQVLAVEDAILRDYDSQSGVRQQIDLMVRVVRPVEDAAVDASKYQGGVVVRADGRFRVFHADGSGGTTSSVASDTVYADGDWVRVTMAFDYTLAQPSFTLRLNGRYCGAYPCAGGKTRVAGMDVTGSTALDDVIFTDGAPAFEVAADPSSTVPAGVTVSCAWLDRYGLAWNDTESDADKDGLKVWQEYLSGSSPLDGTSVFSIADFRVDGSIVSITFTGDLPRPDFLKVRWCENLGGKQTEAAGVVTQENGVSVWSAEVPVEARFFRAYLEK